MGNLAHHNHTFTVAGPGRFEHLVGVTTTLEEIHRDPAILDRAISRQEPLNILADGEVAATLLPKAVVSLADVRRVMQARFAAPDWEFTVGAPMSRDERNARG